MDGEDPCTRSGQAAHHWLKAYAELLELEADLLDMIAERMPSMSDEARHEAARASMTPWRQFFSRKNAIANTATTRGSSARGGASTAISAQQHPTQKARRVKCRRPPRPESKPLVELSR